MLPWKEKVYVAVEREDVWFKNSYSFGNIISDQSNRFAIAVGQVLANMTKEINPVMLYGPSGIGKTHIACSVGEVFASNNKTVVYTDAREIMENIIEYEENTDEPPKLNQGTDLLIVDDCDFLCGKPASQEQFAKLLFNLIENGTQVIIITTLTPNKLSVLSSILFENNEKYSLKVSVEKPSENLKKEYLSKMADEFQIPISEELSSKIAAETEILPEIRGMLLRLKALNN